MEISASSTDDRGYLASWGMNITKQCPFCTMEETIEHALLNCYLAKNLWQKLKPTLDNLNGNPMEQSLETVLFNTTANHEPAQSVIQYMTYLAVSILWTSRNRHVVAINRRLVDPIILFKCELKGRIEHDKQFHKTNIIKYWSHKNILCSYESNILTLNF